MAQLYPLKGNGCLFNIRDDPTERHDLVCAQLPAPTNSVLPNTRPILLGSFQRGSPRLYFFHADACTLDNVITLVATAQAAQYPERVAAMWTKLEAYEATAFNPHRGNTDPEACITAATKWGGFWGPWMP